MLLLVWLKKKLHVALPIQRRHLKTAVAHTGLTDTKDKDKMKTDNDGDEDEPEIVDHIDCFCCLILGLCRSIITVSKDY